MKKNLFLLFAIVSVVSITNSKTLCQTSLGKSPSGKVEIILGYLYVYPEDLGMFNGEPKNVIRAVNDQKLGDYNDWRLPTNEELSLMATAKDRLGIGSISDYMSRENCGSLNGKIVRLVRITEKYIVTFNPNGGNGNMPSQSFEKGVKQRLVANKFTRNNYLFVSWTTNNYGKEYADEDYIDDITSDITLYAKWTPAYAVTFYPNGGSGSMSPQTFGKGIKQKLCLNSFVRKNKKFLSWNTESDGTGTEYKDGDIISIEKDMVLYAQWNCIVCSGSLNGHEWVDLGLPSGTKWATCNVGASSPREYGNYYYHSLQSNVDIATNKWGGSWHVPTEEQWNELKNNCKWNIFTDDCCEVVGPNGNHIFLPYAGSRWGGNDNDKPVTSRPGERGEYWMSSYCYGYGYCCGKYFHVCVAAPYLEPSNRHVSPGTSTINCLYLMSVRPVCE